MGWKKWPLRFQIDGQDGAGAVQVKDRGDYRQQLRSCAAHTSSSLSFSLFRIFCYSPYYSFSFASYLSSIYFSLSLLPFKTSPLRQLISTHSSVIQPPLLSLPFSLLAGALSVFGWWPVLETEPKAAFLHLLLSRLRSIVDVDYCCFHFVAPPFHLFRIVQNNNNNSKKIEKKKKNFRPRLFFWRVFTV